MLDKRADQEAIRLLYKVQRMSRELRALEAQFSKACLGYGRRRGYFSYFRECHLIHDIEQNTQTEGKAA